MSVRPGMGPKPTLRVLVDDDPTTLETFSEAFRHTGFDVEAAPTMAAALESLGGHRWRVGSPRHRAHEQTAQKWRADARCVADPSFYYGLGRFPPSLKVRVLEVG